MIDDSCEVPRKDLDEGFNPCRKQVVENGELCQYAHMYDVMNERYDREEDTSYLNSVKRDRITQSTSIQTVGEGKLYAQNGQGVEGFIKSSGTLDPTTQVEIPSSKAVADYVSSQIPDISALEAEIEGKLDKEGAGTYNRVYTVDKEGTQYTTPIASSVTPNGYIPNNNAITDYAPIPLPISKGGTGGNTPYMTDDLDNSATFVMYDEQNARYDAAPMSALTNYLATQFMSFDNEDIPDGADLNTYQKPGNYSVRLTSSLPTIVNAPIDISQAFNLYVVPILTTSHHIAQYIVEYVSGRTYYRDYAVNVTTWNSWKLLYPTTAPSIPNPLPVDQGGTGVQSRNSVAVSASQGIPLLTNGGPDGPINSWTTVEAMGTFFNRTVVNPQIANAFTTHTATTVADNNLLPTNALMIDYVAAHAMDTPPSKFSYTVSPFPSDTWEGEMTVNVVPVVTVTKGNYNYIIARVYGTKTFNYTGTADNINLFLSLKAVGDDTSIFSGSTNIPLILDVSGRSYTAGTYGLTPNGSSSNLSLNNQIVSSVFNLGDLNISTNLKCVFGEGTKTPGVSVTVNCIALMWRSLK